MTSSNIRVRRAMLQDEASFRALWKKYMEHQFDEGGLQLPNEHNLDIYMNLFRAFVGGTEKGIVLMVSDGSKDVGVQMDGTIKGSFELSIGPYSMLYGIYYESEYRNQGITHMIHKIMTPWIRENGFTGGVTGILAGGKTVPQVLEHTIDRGPDAAGAVKPHAIQLYWEFEKPRDAD